MPTNSFDKRFVVKRDAELDVLLEVLGHEPPKHRVDSSISTAHAGDSTFNQILERFRNNHVLSG